ncbi:hypothetical protein [Azospirillum soli]|uniref:hypothetical protein n=1 Tax=Azospirillum soli TaxID=1304799 RepID=UPI001FE564D8|nr:hypothetical protein [Azospirillum soli]MBP2314169.1 hypothetical protein [Azospirillum soli]
MRLAGVAVLLGAMFPGMALAQAQDAEHMKLSTGLPISIEDAAKIEKGSVDVKMRGYYDRLKENGGRNLFTLDPEFEVGVADGLALKLSPAYRLGNAEDAQQGDLELKAEYNILAPTQGRLGLSIEPVVALPYGSGGKTTEAGASLRVTQPLGTSDTAPRLHVNLGWRHLFDPAPDERDNRFLKAAGVNVAVAPVTAVAFDVVREESKEDGKARNFVEAGVRHMLAEKLAVGAGVGVGFGPDSPRYRVLVGVQKSF